VRTVKQRVLARIWANNLWTTLIAKDLFWNELIFKEKTKHLLSKVLRWCSKSLSLRLSETLSLVRVKASNEEKDTKSYTKSLRGRVLRVPWIVVKNVVDPDRSDKSSRKQNAEVSKVSVLSTYLEALQTTQKVESSQPSLTTFINSQNNQLRTRLAT